MSPSSLQRLPSPRIAVVGCGHWGKNLVRNFHRLGHLAAICDLNPDMLAPLRPQYPHALITTDFQDILTSPDIDGIVISTPSATHYRLAHAALSADKHVYVEKPVATRADEVQDLYALSATRGRTLMVGHLLLYHPAVSRLRQLIQAGELGEVRYVQSDRLNFNANRQDTSVLWDLAPHDLSMIGYLLGSLPLAIASVTGHRTSPDQRVDIVHLELKFPGDVVGHIHNSWVHPFKQVRLIVRGSEKTAVLDDTLGEGKLKLYTRGENPAQATEIQPEYLSLEPLKLECQHFLRCIQSGDRPRTDAVNGYDVVHILQLAEQMLQEPAVSHVAP